MTDPREHASEPQPRPRMEATAQPRAARRWLRLAVLALVTAAGSAGAFLLYARWSRTPPPTAPTTVSLESPYESEEDWLVSRIVEDLWGLAALRRVAVTMPRPPGSRRTSTRRVSRP